ncbi:MAG: glycoside hydrolase family 5 protein, partial [Duncaniella sp.]|nr:glycoside hydrolase family 5 protein [Duncaniella sp.]
MIKKILLSAALSLICAPVYADTFETAAQAVANMRLGWNLGNTLDSNSGDLENMWIERWTERKPSDYETAWGQPVTKPELFKMFKDAGFNAIRVPVTWYPHMEAKFDTDLKWDPASDPIGTKIQDEWMKRVHEVVDYVISQDMYCIINIHHDTGAATTGWLVADEKEYAAQKERFEAIWTQIAEEFKDYGEHLLFEGYN